MWGHRMVQLGNDELSEIMKNLFTNGKGALTQEGVKALEVLADFCNLYNSVYNGSSNDMLVNEGRRQVILFILQAVGLQKVDYKS